MLTDAKFRFLKKVSFIRLFVLFLGLVISARQLASVAASAANEFLPHDKCWVSPVNHQAHLCFIYESIAEQESEEETEDKQQLTCGNIFTLFSFNAVADSSPIKTLFSRVEETLQHRFTASLYELHHCWRNALV